MQPNRVGSASSGYDFEALTGGQCVSLIIGAAALNWEKAKYAFNSLGDWLSEDLATAGHDAGHSAATTRKSGRARLIFACVIIFAFASGFRLLHWQDGNLRGGLESLARRYVNQARQILRGDGILYPGDKNEVPNGQLLVHPPGYSVFVAAVFGLAGDSNNAIIAAQIIADGAAAVIVTLMFRVGPTAQVWTRTVRPTVRSIQRNLYTTSRMLPLIIAGIVLLGIARRKNVLLLFLAVPACYLCVQSAFHTEYRYILAIHYFLFIMAAVTVYFAGKLIGLGVHRVAATFGSESV